MTALLKPVRRETYSNVRDGRKSRPLMITLHATYLTIRPKGRRYAYTVTYDQVFNIGAKNAAEQLRKAKVEARKARAAQ
jgi:hypothetical protein